MIMTCVIMAKVVMVYIAMAYIVMAYIVMAHIVMAFTAMANKVAARMVMTKVVMAPEIRRRHGRACLPQQQHCELRQDAEHLRRRAVHVREPIGRAFVFSQHLGARRRRTPRARCRSEGYSKTRLTESFPTPPSDSIWPLGVRRRRAPKGGWETDARSDRGRRHGQPAPGARRHEPREARDRRAEDWHLHRPWLYGP